MALLRYSACRFGLLPAWLVVVVMSPLCCSRRCRHVESRSSSWCWADSAIRHQSFLFEEPPCPLHHCSSSPASLGFASLFDLLSLISIRCHWSRFAVVGFESPCLVSWSSQLVSWLLRPSVSFSSPLSSFYSSQPSSSPSSSGPSSFSPLHRLTPSLHCLALSSSSPLFSPSSLSLYLPLFVNASPLIVVASGSRFVLLSVGEMRRGIAKRTTEPQQMLWSVLGDSRFTSPPCHPPSRIFRRARLSHPHPFEKGKEGWGLDPRF